MLGGVFVVFFPKASLHLNINLGNYTSVPVITAPGSTKRFQMATLFVSMQLRLDDEHLKKISKARDTFKYS